MASGGNAYKAQMDAQKQRSDQLYGLMTNQLTQAQTKSPLQQGIEQQNQDWLNFTKDPKRDFRNAPGLAFTGMFNDALQQREDDRKGIGGLAMGSGNGQLADVLKSQRADRAAERGGIGLANAVQTKDANVRGDTMSMINLQNNKDTGLFGSLGGIYGNQNQAANSMFINRPSSPLWGIAAAGIQGLAGNAKLAGMI